MKSPVKESSAAKQRLEKEEEDQALAATLQNYSFQSWPNALETIRGSKSIQKSLLKDCASAATARSQLTNGDYSHGTTFWVSAADALEKKPATTTTLESLALQIFQAHIGRLRHSQPKPITVIDLKNSGAEWWTLYMDGEDGGVGWHWDKDYHSELCEGQNIHPHLATVTYLSDIGAPTMIVPQKTAGSYVSSQDYINTSDGTAITSAYLSRPILGKHIAFDGRLLHSAPTEVYDEIKFRNPKITTRATGNNNRGPRPKRATLLVNIWINHKPKDAVPICDNLQARLSKIRIKIGDLTLSTATTPFRIMVVADTPSSSSVNSQKQVGGHRKNGKTTKKKSDKSLKNEDSGHGIVCCSTKTVNFDWKLNDDFNFNVRMPVDALAEAWDDDSSNCTFQIQWGKGTIRPYIEGSN